MVSLLIDGGYLSFWLAASNYTYELTLETNVYSKYAWILDGKRNIRRDEYPAYKANRKGVNPELRYRVNNIRNLVRAKYRHYVDEQLEADDLIALVHYLLPYHEFITIANDKDMLQIPNIHLWQYDKEHTVIEKTISDFKAAKTIKPYLQKGTDLLMYQALLGDKTDNIFPIMEKLPTNRFDYAPLIEWLQSDSPFTMAYYHYGIPFYENLKLVLLPHPLVLLDDVNPMELMGVLDEYHSSDFNWVNHYIKPHYRDLVIDMVGDMGIADNSDSLYNWFQRNSINGIDYIEKVLECANPNTD